jgi:hypothetical protein
MIHGLQHKVTLPNCTVVPSQSLFCYAMRTVGKQKTVGKPGKLYNYQIILNKNMLFKLIYINKLKLPDVLIDIIKDYLYYSYDTQLHKSLQENINHSIKHDIYREGKCLIGKTDEHIYEYQIRCYIRENKLRYENGYEIKWSNCFIIQTCTQCGNYTNNDLYENTSYSSNMLCCCHNTPNYQTYYNNQNFYVKNLTSYDILVNF